MRILELRVKNVRNLKVVEIKPDETAVLLTGKNGAGKSAVLDSIFMALTGKKIQEPIRRGEKRAEICVDLGDVTVKRIFTDEEDRLEVWNKERVLIQSPQAFLDKLLGKLALDPLAFKNMKAKEKSKLLRKIGKLPLAGLSVEGGEVLFKGIAFDQLSLGEQLRISTAVAMSLNPQFRVIFLRYGSLFDEEGLEAIVGIALERSYQVWIEKVDQSGEVGIYLENGEVVAMNGKRKKEALAGASKEI